jgi:hypothetical protein
MKLSLALVQQCHQDACEVVLLNGRDPFHIIYSAPVRERIRIQTGQLVALDLEPTPPQLVWRWIPNQVHEVEPERVLVGQDAAHVSWFARIPGLADQVRPGDEVWVCGTPEGWELHDLIVDGGPANPTQLAAMIFPRIEALYRELIG